METLLVDAEVGGPVDGEGIYLLKAPLIQEDVQPLAGGHLAAFVLGLDALEAAPQLRLFLQLEQAV